MLRQMIFVPIHAAVAGQSGDIPDEGFPADRVKMKPDIFARQAMTQMIEKMRCGTKMISRNRAIDALEPERTAIGNNRPKFYRRIRPSGRRQTRESFSLFGEDQMAARDGREFKRLVFRSAWNGRTRHVNISCGVFVEASFGAEFADNRHGRSYHAETQPLA
jgi:hypothetical protein